MAPAVKRKPVCWIGGLVISGLVDTEEKGEEKGNGSRRAEIEGRVQRVPPSRDRSCVALQHGHAAPYSASSRWAKIAGGGWCASSERSQSWLTSGTPHMVTTTAGTELVVLHFELVELLAIRPRHRNLCDYSVFFSSTPSDVATGEPPPGHFQIYKSSDLPLLLVLSQQHGSIECYR
jgi:hypothetical protein